MDGEEYKFLCIAKGGGSANKTYLYQETKALLSPGKLKDYLVDKMRILGTAACPPYHVAFVIGGASAEATLKTVKLASTKYYDGLPTEGNEYGQAFRDMALETELLAELLKEAQNLGLGAQFGGKYFAHDIRVVRLPRHGASCPVGVGYPVLLTVILKARSTVMASGWKNWSATQASLFRRHYVKQGKAKRSRSTSISWWLRS